VKHATKHRRAPYRRFEFQPRHYNQPDGEFQFRLQEFQRQRREKDEMESLVAQRAKNRDKKANQNRILRMVGLLLIFGYLIYKLGGSYLPGWGEVEILDSKPLGEALVMGAAVLGMAAIAKTFIKLSRKR
jgi:hypothetical protein